MEPLSIKSLPASPIQLIGNFLRQDICIAIEGFIKDALSIPPEIGVWKQLNADQNLRFIFLNSSVRNDAIKEYHQIFTDIHITLKGKDSIFFGETVQNVVEPYNSVGDYSLVNSETIRVIASNPNHFVIIRKEVIHCNVLEGPDPLKMVVKIKDNLCLK